MCKILIIDDDKDHADSLRTVLRSYGYTSYVSYDGSAGMQTAREVTPDVILLDVCMEGCTGYEVCAELKNDPDTEAIQVIYLSGLMRNEDRLRGLALGGNDFITKPCDVEDLLERIRARLPMTAEEKLDRIREILLSETSPQAMLAAILSLVVR